MKSLLKKTLLVVLAAMVSTSAFGAFEKARRSVSNIVYSDLAIPQTLVRPIFINHNFPDQVSTTLGDLKMGGDLQLYALQFEYAWSERLGIVALKDGYISYNPDSSSVFSDESGMADLAAGVKYALILDKENEYALSAKVVIELPTGDSEVWQGNGDGSIDPALQFLKLKDDWQFSGTVGGIIPFDDERSTMGYVHAHASYWVSEMFMPLVEFNAFKVLDAGNGATNFEEQVGGAVPSVVKFEGSDLVNFGGANAEDNDTIATIAIGARSRVQDNIDIGLVYEFPLTDEEESLLKDRITFDVVYRF